MRAAVNDALIHYEIEGPAGAPVVTLSHSLATALELWDLQLPALSESYRLLRFDTRGHGSLAPPGPYTMEMLAADLVGLLDHLHIEQTHFVGISMGGMNGQVLVAPQSNNSLVAEQISTTLRGAPGIADGEVRPRKPDSLHCSMVERDLRDYKDKLVHDWQKALNSTCRRMAFSLRLPGTAEAHRWAMFWV